MMHLRFMSICDLLLFLLSVSSAVIFFTFTPSSSFANTNQSVTGEGMSYWDDRTSKKDACDIAELEADGAEMRNLESKNYYAGIFLTKVTPFNALSLKDRNGLRMIQISFLTQEKAK